MELAITDGGHAEEVCEAYCGLGCPDYLKRHRRISVEDSESARHKLTVTAREVRLKLAKASEHDANRAAAFFVEVADLVGAPRKTLRGRLFTRKSTGLMAVTLFEYEGQDRKPVVSASRNADGTVTLEYITK